MHRDALFDSISDQELQTIRLKKRISELEDALTPKPLFANPLAILPVEKALPSTLGTSKPITKALQLLNGVRGYVVENINKRLDIIRHAWEVSITLRNLSKRITNFTEHLRKYLEHDQAYYQNEVSTFIARVTSMNEYQRNQKWIPSDKRIKKIKVGWEAQINVLKGAMVACEKINGRRGDATLKAISTVKELQGPYFFQEFNHNHQRRA
jgi:hypothetical protein